jgi:Glycosyltransferase family 87
VGGVVAAEPHGTDTSRQPEGEAADPSADGWPPLALWMTVATAVLLGAVLVYEGWRLGFFSGLNENDDGLYYGEGVMLAHGLLPYRSYVDVQPPAMAIVMAPFGLLGRLTSNRVGFEWARAFVIAVAVANVALLGRLIRRRHWVGVLTGLVVFAFYEDSLIGDHTVLLEPFLVFGTLVAFLCVFNDTETATRSSLRWLAAGAAIGLTTSLKLWEVFPFLVLLAFAATRGRQCISRFVVGTVVGVGIVSLPFFLVAPSTFVHQVIVVQATRTSVPDQVTSLRLMQLLGITGHQEVAAGAWFLLVVVVVASVVYARRVDATWSVNNLDVCAMACFLVVFGSFMVSPEFDTHYGGFLAPFLALVVSATVVRFLPLSRTIVAVIVVVAAVGFVAHAVRHVADQQRESIPVATIDRIFPPSACVISVSYGPLILADRYNLNSPQCPRALDIYGTELTDGPGIAHDPSDGTASKVQSDWLGWLQRVDGLVLIGRVSTYPDIGPAVRSYIASQFTLTKARDDLFIYHRARARGAAAGG